MEIIKKITLAGDGLVGKTSLIRRYVLDHFDDKYTVTIGTKVTKKNIKMNRNGEDTDITFMIWDIMGLTGYHSELHKKNFQGTKGAIIVCDVTRLDTLISLSTWAHQIKCIAGEIPMVFIYNKSDLIDKAEVTETEIKEEAKKHNAPYLLTSAKTGENVEKAFNLLAESIMEKHDAGK
jgi:small GTP-binding protein